MKNNTIFVHSLWRTGSTYVWNKFRSHDNFYCYYEPFNESLISSTRDHLETVFSDNKTNSMRHPKLSKEYQSEFPLDVEGGVPFFKKEFCYDLYFLEENDECDDILKYLNFLLDVEKPVVLQFCRSASRMGWIKKNFVGTHIYLVRNPRDQFESYISFESNYFMGMLLLIIAKNQKHPKLMKLVEDLEITYYSNESIENEFIFYQTFVKKIPLEHQYFIFYYIWLLSLKEAEKYCDIIIDINSLSKDSTYIDEKFKSMGINISFSDCNIPEYSKYSIDVDQLKLIEDSVRSLF